MEAACERPNPWDSRRIETRQTIRDRVGMTDQRGLRRAACNVRVFIGKGVPYWHFVFQPFDPQVENGSGFRSLSITETWPGCQQFSLMRAPKTEKEQREASTPFDRRRLRRDRHTKSSSVVIRAISAELTRRIEKR